MHASGNTGPLGQPRGVAFVIILSIVTLGIYSPKSAKVWCKEGGAK